MVSKIFIVILFTSFAFVINDVEADGWKFWKKSSTTTTSTTTESSPVGSVNPNSGVGQAIANAGNPSLAVGANNAGTIRTSTTPRPRLPNPGTEVGWEEANSRPKLNNQDYRNLAIDLTGAAEPARQPSKPGSPSSPGSALPSIPAAGAQRPISNPAPNPAQNKPVSSTTRPIEVSTTARPIPGAPLNPATPQNGQKLSGIPAGGSLPGSSWAEVASRSNSPTPAPRSGSPAAGPRPGLPTAGPTPTSRPGSPAAGPVPVSRPGSPATGPAAGPRPGLPTPARPSPDQSLTRPGAGAAVGAAAVGVGAAAIAGGSKKAYSSNPIYSKGNTVTDEDLEKLSEALFLKDNNNAFKYITMDLQKQTHSDNSKDEAPLPLLKVNSAALQIPTISKVLTIYDNYQLDTRINEHISPLQRTEESLLVDTFLSTNVMSAAMRFLADKGFLKQDYYEYKDTLRRLWFNLYSRGEGKIGSSGFEHVFLTELKLGTEISGLHNWIYFNAEEAKNKINYLGYIKKLDLGDKGAILKIHAKFNDIDKPVTTMFVGTSPELEMALYTVCFLTRPDSSCPVSLGGSKFNIVTHKFRYRGNDLIGSAYPAL
ncbi:poly(U)-specific endoribonuclease homolog isoform X2 [Cotesia glomerata]|uniref:poly(U)-specific endoribonuclease homolog isoform X2 n=1 Tax=Cotesia glomerata TaxID=32391 RepID=UPI001D020C94|nr:poly(U)-specific endoribonuclease homolog isoform X2 [Cotesia glomerata]